MTSSDHEFDLFGPDMLRDPYTVYARLREVDPVHWSPPLDSWVLTRYADVSAALHDPALSSTLISPEHTQDTDPTNVAEVLARTYTFVNSSLVFSDPPEHTRLRRLVSRAFAPGVVERLRDVIAATTVRLLDRSGDRLDVIAELAEPLPMTVLGELLGASLSDSDRSKIKSACDDFLLPFGRHLSSLTDAELARAQAAGLELDEFVDTVLDRPAREDDVVGRMLAGEAEDRLTHKELYANVVLFLIAGHENLTSLLGNGAATLLELPDVQRAAIRDDPGSWTGVVDELLRLVTPNQFVRRQAQQDVVIGDRTIRAGQSLLLVLAAANRDPEQYPAPDRFELHRPDRRDLSMGLGRHYCLGAPLARLETRIALRILFERYPGIRLADVQLEWVPNFNVRLLRSLPVITG
jgi:cytochrome P450